MRPVICIAGRPIGPDYPPYIVAEMSANHNGSFESAKRIITTAAECGAHAIKIQTYRPDTLTIKSDHPDFLINDGLWKGQYLYDLYQWAHTPWDWHKVLFDHAHSQGITIFSSPFDKTAIDLLEDLNAPAYKIASFESVDLDLIKYAASTGKPLIISTGMASIEEITEAIQAAHDGGCKELALLHCVSGYPAPACDYNLLTIPEMISRFGLVTGLSDHTLDNTTAIASVALGASMIEKHFTLNRNGGGPDDSFSLEPHDLKTLCRDAFTAKAAIGQICYRRKESELGNVKFRRSLYIVKNMQAGESFTEDNLRSIRPGYGIPPKYFQEVLGKRITKDAKAGTALHWDLIT